MLVFLRLPSRAQALVDTGCTAVLMLCALGVMGTLLKRSLQRPASSLGQPG